MIIKAVAGFISDKIEVTVYTINNWVSVLSFSDIAESYSNADPGVYVTLGGNYEDQMLIVLVNRF